MKMPRLFLLGSLCLLLLPQIVQAHFPWLEIENRDSDRPRLQVFFSESPVRDDPELLKYVSKAEAWQVGGRGEPKSLELTKTDSALLANLEPAQVESLFVLKHDLGVMNRGDAQFRIRYASKTGPALSGFGWRGDKTKELLHLDVTPAIEEGQLVVRASFQGKPAVGAEVTLLSDLVDLDSKLTTNENGKVTFNLEDSPIHAVRVKYVEPSAGEVDGKKYNEIRYYTTVTFPEASYKRMATTISYPAIPETVTSFGAAVANQHLYVYGGHTGGAHSYSDEGQAQTLWSLDLKNGQEWKALAKGPRLQGLAMVAHDGKLYRMGGFTAKNKEGEEHDLWSQDSFASFDLETGSWTDLPALPEPRSSFDAAVLDGKIYVVGGWTLAGGSKSQWLETAWSFDLNDPKAEWKKLPTPPFQKRALSVAAFEGKIYAIGGMQKRGGATTQVEVFDPQTGTWSPGPKLIGGSMTGFGTSAFAVNDTLYVSTYDGTLQTLAGSKSKKDEGQNWKLEGNLENARFFHRMLPIDDHRLIFVGGSNMQIGKFEDVEVLEVGSQKDFQTGKDS